MKNISFAFWCNRFFIFLIMSREFPTAFSGVLKTEKGVSITGRPIQGQISMYMTVLLLVISFFLNMLIPIVGPWFKNRMGIHHYSPKAD